MGQRVNADAISGAISKILDEYGEQASDAIREVTPKVARKAAKQLRSKKSFAAGGHPTGKYAGGWKVKVEEHQLSTDAIVYNGSEPGLPHLLEFGHANRGGGRTPAYPHIAEVEQEAVKEFEDEIRKKMESV